LWSKGETEIVKNDLGLSGTSYGLVSERALCRSATSVSATASIGDGGLQGEQQCEESGDGNGLPIREPFHANPP